MPRRRGVTGPTTDVRTALERLAQPAPHLRWRLARADEPLGDDELACAALATDPDALAAAVAATATGRGSDDPQVLASLWWQAYAYRVGGTALACWLLSGVAPDPRAEGTAVGIARSRPSSVVYRAEAATPDAGPGPAPSADRPAGADLATLVDRLFPGHLDRVAGSLRARHTLGRSLIWGNVAAACAAAAGAVRGAATRLARPARCVPRRRPPRPGGLRPLDVPAGRRRPHRRPVRRPARRGRRLVRRPHVPAHDVLPVVEDVRRRRRPLRRLLPHPLPDRDLPHMILFLSNADTELLALGSIVHRLPDGFPAVRAANPGRLAAAPDLDGVTAVVVRLLGGRTAWEPAFDELRAACVVAEVPLVALGGEAEPDAELTRLSTVPAGTAREAHRYLAAGGPPNVEHLLRFVADTVLLGGFGFDPPRPLPLTEVWDGGGLGVAGAERDPARPLVGVVFYRAHRVAGNTQFVADLCRAIEEAGGDALPVSCYSLRPDADGRVEALELLRTHGVEVLVTTVLAMGRSGGTSDDEGDDWQVPQLADLGVPVIQAPACNRSRDDWADDEAGLTPLDVAMGVAIPEFDGRIIGPAFAFKEEVDDGGDLGTPVIASRTDPERAARVAGLAVRHARLRRIPPADKRVAVVMSAYPTKRSRLGNAVGLDTPASVVELLHALRDAGYMVDRIPEDGDALMAELAERFTYESPQLTPDQARVAAGRLPATEYTAWFDHQAPQLRSEVTSIWGEPPGEVYVVPTTPDGISPARSVAPATDLAGKSCSPGWTSGACW